MELIIGDLYKIFSREKLPEVYRLFISKKYICLNNFRVKEPDIIKLGIYVGNENKKATGIISDVKYFYIAGYGFYYLAEHSWIFERLS